MLRLCSVLFFAVVVPSAIAQQFDFSEVATQDPALLSKAVAKLAEETLPVYKEQDRAVYLNNLALLQAASGEYSSSVQSFAALREYRRSTHVFNAAWLDLQYEIYVRAKSTAATQSVTFDKAYEQEFHSVFAQLDGPTSARAMPLFNVVDESWWVPSLQNDLDAQKGKSKISAEAAVTLVHDYEQVQGYRETASFRPALIAEDDARRYTVQNNIQVKTSDGGSVCAMVVLPKSSTGRLPSLFFFTIYHDADGDLNDARLSAAHGYASVAGYTRGKACSPDKPVPYEHDGRDAASLIDWIAAQPWSDSRVGMYQGSYDGFTQWAVAKYMPKGLKAMMTGAPAAPGIDVPMEGNVSANFLYPWPFYTTDGHEDDNKVYGDYKRWQKLDHNWYTSGRAYRDLDKIDGKPNRVWDKWLEHPAYDAYWQSMIPYKQEFARINVPVLITIGYYAGGPEAGVYYFREREKYNPTADDYLLIGPYGHIEAQYGPFNLPGDTMKSQSGLKLDPLAIIDLVDLRYAWFDSIFKGGARPDLLRDKVNYEVTGANVWKHASSFEAISPTKRRVYLSAVRRDSTYGLSEHKDASEGSIDLTVDLADRSDVDRKVPGGGVEDTELDTWNGVEFLGDPLPEPLELSGLFSGHLDFRTNKKDFDFEMDLYELTSHGEYVQLAPFWSRASFVDDRSHRHLLTPGKRERIDFRGNRMMSRQLQQGSRIVAVFKVIKETGREINYGTGRDVSTETIGDAGAPLVIHWLNSTYLDLPIGK